MRLAAIDVGSNSVHMVVADLGRGGHLEVLDRVKEMVRLGRGCFTTGKLSSESMDLAVRALANFQLLARVRGVDRMRAVATSAVREAKNRASFIRRIQRETGLDVEVISGDEEARLIFYAARHALGLDGGPFLLVDVGGGSVELVLAKNGRALWMQSVKLGAARLTQRFFTDDPPSRRQVSALEKHLDQQMGAYLKAARDAGAVSAIGTSGTINSLVAMARAARGEDFGRLHGARATALEIASLSRQLLKVNTAARAELPGADAKRADQMPAAGLLADFILTRSGARELAACGWALREGLLLELARATGSRHSAQVRKRSVEALGARFADTSQHGRQVARLALTMFDAIGPELKLPARSRELLEYSALLHDIGHAIDHDRHDRHSYYLIKNAELFGFDPVEVEIIAQSARGHRKQAPKAQTPNGELLSRENRQVVRALAAILRVADALDRSHFGVVKGINVTYTPGRLVVGVDSVQAQADLELWACETRKDLLSKLLDSRVIVRAQATGE